MAEEMLGSQSARRTRRVPWRQGIRPVDRREPLTIESGPPVQPAPPPRKRRHSGDVLPSTLYRRLGAHPDVVDGVAGTRFAVWAPNARDV